MKLAFDYWPVYQDLLLRRAKLWRYCAMMAFCCLLLTIIFCIFYQHSTHRRQVKYLKSLQAAIRLYDIDKNFQQQNKKIEHEM